MALGIPHFHNENLVEFHVWCTMVNRQGFASMYTVRIDMLVLRQAEYSMNIHGNQCHSSDMDKENHTMMIMHTI